MNDLDSFLKGVEPRWHGAFARFFERGELDPDFEAALDVNPTLQAAVDAVLDAHARGLKEADRRGGTPTSPAHVIGDDAAAGELLAMGIAAAFTTPAPEVPSMFEEARTRVPALVSAEAEPRALAALEKLENGVRW